MPRSSTLCGLAIALLVAGAPPVIGGQEGRDGDHLKPDTLMAEAQALLESGRPIDTERLLEKAVIRRPLVVPELEGRSSALAVLYLRVRARVLPVMAETLYGSAKAAYDEGRLDLASTQFDELRRLVDSAGPRIDGLSDLGMLAEGFSRLIRRQLEPRPAEIPAEYVRADVESPGDPPSSEPPVPLVDATSEPGRFALDPKPFASWRPATYGPDDADVTPPGTIEQTLPPWVAPAGFARRTFRGLLAVVVGEDGLVASAEIVDPTFPAYDAVLLSVAKRWRYEPAGKDGRAVRFRKLIAINLLGRPGS